MTADTNLQTIGTRPLDRFHQRISANQTAGFHTVGWHRLIAVFLPER